MTTVRHRRPDLANRRDAAILMHVLRNFVTTAEVVHQLFFRELSLDTSRKVLRRLVDRKFLNEFPLFANKNYYRLGPAAVTRWDYPRSRSEKLGAQRLPYELGTLAYTCLDEKPRKRLLAEEIKEHWPWFPHRFLQWAYILDGESLGTIRVEVRTRPQRMIAKLAEQAYRYRETPEFRELIESGNFFFVVVTATELQELAVQAEAQEQGLAVSVRTSHYPELVRFI